MIQPELMPGGRSEGVAQVLERVRSYTPEWTNLRSTDAGIALVRIFSEQMEPVLKRLNRLPEKAFVEFLTTAGLKTLPPRPAVVMLELDVAEGAAESVLIGRGFQVGAKPAGGTGDLVVFETNRSFYAAPAKIAELHLQLGGLYQQVDLKGVSEASPFLPFGKKPVPGGTIFMGLSGTASPGPTINLWIGIAEAGAPPPAASGGLMPLAIIPPPLLRWEVLDAGSYEPAEVIVDETGGLFRSGIVELRLPRRWRTGSRPEGMPGEQPLRWLRLRMINGRYSEPPRISALLLNAVEAVALRTVRDEVLGPVPDSDGRRMRLSQTPILPGSVVLEVDDGSQDFEPLQDSEAETLSGPEAEKNKSALQPLQAWREVDDLSLCESEDRVYVLDSRSGELTFGDGMHGALLPQGFRNVRAVKYSVGGGADGAVDAESASTMLTAVPFVSSVKNPFAASGGSDGETRQQAMIRGPQEIRARERAVTVADYALLALRAPGASVQRAHAVSGRHPSYPGQLIPGVVGVFVVPPDRGAGPPMPDQVTLHSIAEYLSKQAAPAGSEIVAAAPRYHRVRAEVTPVIQRDADASETVRRLIEAVDRYLHPLSGGDEGQGWPFGGTLRHSALMRLLSNVEGVSAISRLALVVDGRRVPSCTDYSITDDSLFWPESHQVEILETEERL